MKKRWSKSEVDYLITNYHSNPVDIANVLNRSVGSVIKRAQRLGICRSKQRVLNHQYFTIQNEENCYWAGFIAADGFLPKNKYQVVISLASKDREHLEKFKFCLQFDGDVIDREYSYCSFSSILIPSKQIYDDLNNNFNITPQKSLTLCPPKLNCEDHIRSFIRGYFDGDGCLSTNVSFAGTKQVLVWIQDQLLRYIPNIHYNKICEHGNIFTLNYGGRLQKIKILNWMYDRSNPSVRLGRKYVRRMEQSALV